MKHSDTENNSRLMLSAEGRSRHTIANQRGNVHYTNHEDLNQSGDFDEE